MPNDKIYLGSISRPHGVRGAVRISAPELAPEAVRKVRTIWLGERGCSELRVYGLLSIGSGSGGSIILSLKGVQTVEEAETLRGLEAYVEKDSITLPPDTDLIDDLLGCACVLIETGEQVGICADVQHYPAHDVFVFDSPRGRFMLPGRKEIIPKVDLAERIIYICQRSLTENALWQEG